MTAFMAGILTAAAVGAVVGFVGHLWVAWYTTSGGGGRDPHK